MIRIRLSLFLAAGLLTVFVSAEASQVKLLTFGSASRSSVAPTTGTYVTLGQSLAGRAYHVAGNSMAGLGFWEILSETYVASPVGDQLPGASNRLFANYPNPFNPSTRIRYNLAKETEVRIEVYDLKGRKVDTLARGLKAAGEHTITYKPRHLASGVYLIQMRAGSYRSTQRIMLVK